MNPRSEANNLLEELGISTLPILSTAICDLLDIYHFESPFDGFEGFLQINSLEIQSMIGVNSKIREEGRKNFTGAHELGHFCMDAGPSGKQTFKCSSEMIESLRGTNQAEIRANQFASELLMPSTLFGPLVKAREPDWTRVIELADLCCTSLTTTAIRAVQLTDYPIALIVSTKGNIDWYVKSDEFTAFIPESRVLHKNSYAFRAHGGSPPSEDYQYVEAEWWVEGKGVRPGVEILEWSLPVDSYGRVLTLLYDEDGIQGWSDTGYEDEDDLDEWEPPKFKK